MPQMNLVVSACGRLLLKPNATLDTAVPSRPHCSTGFRPKRSAAQPQKNAPRKAPAWKLPSSIPE